MFRHLKIIGSIMHHIPLSIGEEMWPLLNTNVKNHEDDHVFMLIYNRNEMEAVEDPLNPWWTSIRELYITWILKMTRINENLNKNPF